ncbi:Aa-trans domain-containing protein [Mycena indigotica]|uniref:Aa-trans domain-containing protein n=1 Tax=Mycena indigotica TaxID=2126181 RepID=A0A8H6WHM7_9AGAR|nr:Aa-trans domain-containing protein [Mycena indigotica]KAF7312624.1 Aa-trans domain-containing protein [Mycena indigotica]
MSSPSKPVNIVRRTPERPEEVAGSVTTPYGTPDIRVLRAQYVGTPPPPNIPLRNGSPALAVRHRPSDASMKPPVEGFPGSYGVGGGFRVGTPSAVEAAAASADLENLPEEEMARVLRRHLVSRQERENPADAKPTNSTTPELDVPNDDSQTGSRKSSIRAVQREETEAFPIPYHAAGADVTHDIYKWQSDQRKLGARGRAASVIVPRQTTPDPAFEHIHEPGGFRRNYVILRANERGEEEPQLLNNFVEFLYIFGHFAGEDLEEDDEDEDDEEMGPDAVPNETAPLLGASALSRSRSRSRRRRSSLSRARNGTATVGQAYLMLLKAFVGTGVLFLGKGFYNGGLLFSSILFVFIAFISLYSFLLLVYTKFVVSGSFGDIGGTLYGPWMRYLILGSIIVSQIGFVAAYIIFVSQNLQALVMGITHCLKLIPIQYFILAQLVVFLPLVLFRDLAKLSSTALVADAFILVGLVYIFGSEISIISQRGIADVKMFNPKDFSLFVGVAVYSFEGIGMVIPITDAMREPHKFPKVLTGVMCIVLVLFGGAGALAYLTFGSEVQTVVLVNLDAESKMVQSVQFIYSIAIMLSVPLQLFPAIRIMENGLFTRSGKADFRVKWTKNMFRFATVFFAATLSWLGAADLDKFVAFIGCFACVPLCYVYPAMLHYKACADTPRKKAIDIAMIVFGLVAAAYTTIQTVKLMFEPEAGGPPVFGNCDVPGA